MDVDYYDDDLPEVYTSWADSLSNQKDNALLLAKLIGVPTILSIASFAFVRFIDKKIGSL